MNRMTYKEAYNKIIEAYFKDEIKPMSPQFCFCGTLAPNSLWGVEIFHTATAYPYTLKEYQKMERALLLTMGAREHKLGCWRLDVKVQKSSEYEDRLFEGMCNALDVLKQIHKERGENVEEPETAFVKRQLQTT